MVIIYAIDTYKDLCIDIDVANMNILRFKNEKKSLEKLLKAPGELKAQTYSDMPHGSMNFTTLERIIPNLNRIEMRLEREEISLKGMLEVKEKMNIKLRSLTGMKYKVCKLKEVDGLNYIQIAQVLNINERTARRTMAIIKKESQNNK